MVLTNAEKLRRLHWNTALSATNNIFAILIYFGPAFVLFLHELNFTNTQIGFLLSLLPFTGLIALVIAPAVARFGYRRTFLTFWTTRKFITAGLLLVPWVMATFGQAALLPFVTLIVAGFALCRAVAETALYPWAQEFIPNTIRGRYSAINDIVARLTGIASTALATFILGLPLGLDRFMLLVAIGVIFGLISAWAASHIPGGAPANQAQGERISYGHLARVLKDRNFVLYMAGLSILTIGTAPIGSFIPLYLEQQIGLTESNVVVLGIGGLLGGLISTYMVGWASDRYGSKPVMLSGLYIKILIPFVWMLMPRMSPLSLPTAFLIAFISGSADIAWAIGSGRLLYTSVVPPEKRAEYMAMFYAIIGLTGGLSQFIGGGVLDLTANLTGQFLIFPVDPFFPLFVLAIVLTVVSIFVFQRVKADSSVSVSQFASLFMHGNPIVALESMFRYYRARDERAAVTVTERMAHTKSPLTVDELLEALKDPRFNVRFEAVISIARMDSDPRLVDALCNILDGTELSLSVIAAWALGRIGDERALVSLRHGLDVPYRSIQAHCARSLATLGDTSVIPQLIERLEHEEDKGLRIAYSSALGKLRSVHAIPVVSHVLVNTGNDGARLELTLALARIAGDEHHFIRLLRATRGDKGTAASQSLTGVKRQLRLEDVVVNQQFSACADTFARDDFEAATAQLVELIRALPAEAISETARLILNECATRLDEFKTARHEYLLLTLHTLEVGGV